jgi:hypothetical protein
MAVATAPESQTVGTEALAPVEVEKPIESGIFSYPVNMDSKQDRIGFAVLQYPKQSLSDVGNFPLDSLKSPSGKISDYIPVASEPVVYLPIQSGISDTNAVEWGGAELNAIQKYFATLSLNVMNKGGAAVETALGDAMNTIYSNKGQIFGNLVGAGKLALAEQATGAQGLLSRVTGNVLNPNLELLFRGPTLRPFQFQFKLSPRTKQEADRVKEIIKFFKKNMAVQKNTDLFLRAPYVFGIEYQKGTVNDPHPSIGKIKPCALQAFNVDYTPLGSYMTFDDEEGTMVSYNLSMQFQEIVPITSADYDDNHSIGY